MKKKLFTIFNIIEIKSQNVGKYKLIVKMILSILFFVF